MKAVGDRSDAAESPAPDRARPGDRGPGHDAAAMARDAGRTGDHAPAGRRPLTRRGVLRLQRSAGNAAVSRMVARSRGPTTPPRTKPGQAAAPAPTPASPVTSRAGPGSSGPSPAEAQAATGGAAVAAVDAAGPALAAAGGELTLQRRAATGGGEGGGGKRGGGAGGGGEECGSPPPPPAPTKPTEDPRFVKVRSEVAGTGKALKTHPPAATEAKKASDAAVAPPTDKPAQAKAAQADKMSGAKPKGFDKAAFVAAVKRAVAAKAPKNLDEADRFAESGAADGIKAEVQGKVAEGKQSSAKDIATKTGEPPDMSRAKDKPVTPLRDEPPPRPPTPDAAAAMPATAPPAQTDLRAGKCATDAQMDEADVTDEQLAKSNEPDFTGALAAKKEGEKHSATAPAGVRQAEAQTLRNAEQGAAQQGRAQVDAMTQRRAGVQSQVAGNKGEAKSKDESARARITGEIQKIFDTTKADVEKILTGLDTAVDQKFTAGEAQARAAFEADQKSRMDAYKDKRYSGLTGKARWLKDKFAGLPAEANNLFLESKKVYESKMDTVISQVADHIGTELTRAKDRIAQGREQITKYVASQPKELQQVAKAAAGEIGSQFDQLESDVDSKQESLVEDLATRYVEARNAVDERIKELQDANKGLWDKAKDAIGGAIKTILQLKDMLMGVLAKAASAVAKIIKDPIGFLGNLVSGVGAGLKSFMANIGDHLTKGLVGWLLGAMAAVGLTLPESFDLKGIIVMVGSMLGLTWAAIRTRVVQKGVPEPAMGAVEQSVPVAQKLRSGGIAGIWEDIKAKVGDIKATLFAKISEYLIPTVLIAGITWILSLLNPASAFVKACKMIVDIVMFVVNQGAQIVEFVNAVLDAVIAIAGGAVGGVPALIESALSKSVPVLIGALAAILGIGGIAKKVQGFFKSLTKPVAKAVDFVVDKIVALGKKIWAKLKSKFGKKRKPAKPGKDGKDMSPKEKAKLAKRAANDALRAAGSVPIGEVSAALDDVHARWQPKGLKSLEMFSTGDHRFKVRASVNPDAESDADATIDIEPEQLDIKDVTATGYASYVTAASGAFTVDTVSAVTKIMRSGRVGKRKLKMRDSQEGAHAEEHVVNTFDGAWDKHNQHMEGELESALPPGKKPLPILYKQAQLVINVSKSSCINCATYIVRFIKKLKGKAASVVARMKFASLYTGITEVPRSVMKESGKFVRMFNDKGRLKRTSRLRRLFGRQSTEGGKKEPVHEVAQGHGSGKAGLAILRNAGVTVDVMTEDDVKGQAADEQKKRLKERKEMLEDALAEVEEKILNIRRS